jgi:hypothetical protein
MQAKDENVKKYEVQRHNTNHSSNSLTPQRSKCKRVKQNKIRKKKRKKRSVLKNA